MGCCVSGAVGCAEHEGWGVGRGSGMVRCRHRRCVLD